ncbi:UDP-glycosyltransferase 83A1-like [Salvia miltiorrhiza]|uniref:UDP-glycosyltransferase 83A1-like n=1 Tax=Salvia miltiorrhiza TaxID=226208 RepID=UPI0025AC1285|nr:UDP-glycosyltransferase 83A1-like [Salvia miltiorrhiza]
MAAISGNKPHVLAVAIPAQGHVKPMMSLCRQIAKHGIKVTLVNAQTIHNKIVSSSAAEEADSDGNFVMETVPDGLTPDDDPNSLYKLLQTLPKTMPETLPELIERINGENPNEKISCVIADLSFGWVLEIAEKMGAQTVGFSPPSFATFAILLHLPNLIQQGYIDANGSLENNIDMIRLSDEIPGWRNDEFPWSIPGDLKHQKLFFNCEQSYKAANRAKWLLSNTCYELEPAACDLHPNMLPVGPLHLVETAKTQEKSRSNSGNFYPLDTSCLIWLDTKPPASVIYVSFGSLAVFSQQQLDELALGLELSGRAFLWVVRRDLANGLQAEFPDGFLERVARFGKIVEWAPQDEVLSHPAVACFVSHCGWNSTLEGVSKGLPYLCWPYFADQAHDESYICDKWEIGLRIDCDENRIRSRYEIKKKIDMVLSESRFKENALKLKETCAKSVSEGGSSYKNLMTFIDHLRK